MERLPLLVAALIIACALTASAAERGAYDEPPALLREATRRAANLDDPSRALAYIIAAATRLEPAEAVEVIEAAAGVLEGHEAPPGWHTQWTSLATAVAPLDTAARDRYLRRAVAELDAALADEALWKPREYPPDVHLYQSPEREAAQARQLAELDRRLFALLIGIEENHGERAPQLIELIRDADAAGWFGSCELTTYRWWMLRRWSRLSPGSLLEIAPGVVPDAELAPLAARLAAELTREYGYEPHGRMLLRWADAHSELHVRHRELLMEYRLRERWDAARAMEAGEEQTSRLEAVIAERGGYKGASSGSDAAYQWASRVGDPVLRERLRAVAEASGSVFNRGPDAFPPKPTPEQIRERRGKHDLPVARIVDDPGDLTWLDDPHRDSLLQQAVGVAWWETREWAAVASVVDAIPEQKARDAVLFSIVRRGHEPAGEALRHIESDWYWAISAADLAKWVAERERDWGAGWEWSGG